MFTESLLAAMLTFATWHGDVESPEARSTRLQTIAQAINIATLQAVCAPNAPTMPSLTAPREPEKGEKSKERQSPAPCKRLWRGDAKELAFLLLTQARFETHLALHIHEGKCRVRMGECDGGKATSLWQLQSGGHLPPALWEKLSGTDLPATTHAAFEAARALSRGRNYCGDLSGAIALFATGRTCRWGPAKQRVSFVKRLVSKY